MRIVKLLTPVIAGCAGLVILCAGDPAGPTAGSGSETICGMLVDTTYIPAKRATVVLCVDSAEMLLSRDTTVTNDTGVYFFKSVKGGTYRLRAWDATRRLALLTPPVVYNNPARLLNRGMDTLRAPGSLTGRVVYGLRAVEQAFCYLRQSPFFDYSDTAGFWLGDIPPGTYALRIVPPAPYARIDTTVSIPSGVLVNLGDILLAADPAAAPPWVDSVSGVYDTAAGVVRLGWSPVQVGDLAGYMVFRAVNDSVFREMPTIITGRSFIDSVLAHGIRPGDSLRYYVKAIDTSGALSTQPSPVFSVNVASPVLVRTAVTFARIDTGAFDDSVRLVAFFANPTRTNAIVEWYVDSLAGKRTVRTLAAFAGSDTIAIFLLDTNLHRIYVRFTDAAGSVWIDSTAVAGRGMPIRPGVWRRLADAPCGGPTEICGVWGGRLWVVARPVFEGDRIYGIYSFDIRTSAWAHVSPLPTNRQGAGAAILGDTLYVAGGLTLAAYTSVVEKMMLPSGEWLTSPPLQNPMSRFRMIAAGGSLFCLGGALVDSAHPKITNQMLALVAGASQHPTPMMSVDRASFGLALTGDTIYAIGGQRDMVLASVERHRLPESRAWEQLEPLRIPRRSLGAAALAGVIYAVGGVNADSTIAGIEVFDPRTGRWHAGAPLTVPRSDLGVAACNGQIYAIGGIDKNGAAVGVVEAYLP